MITIQITITTIIQYHKYQHTHTMHRPLRSDHHICTKMYRLYSQRRAVQQKMPCKLATSPFNDSTTTIHQPRAGRDDTCTGAKIAIAPIIDTTQPHPAISRRRATGPQGAPARYIPTTFRCTLIDDDSKIPTSRHCCTLVYGLHTCTIGHGRQNVQKTRSEENYSTSKIMYAPFNVVQRPVQVQPIRSGHR